MRELEREGERGTQKDAFCNESMGFTHERRREKIEKGRGVLIESDVCYRQIDDS